MLPEMLWSINDKDMEIILDALEHYHEYVKTGFLQLTDSHPYDLDDIEGLFESLENAGGNDAT